MNHCIIIGNLTRDPELRVTTNGTEVCTFTVAVQRKYGDKQADFLPIVVWKTLAENCNRFLQKGSKVAVEGEIQTRNYEAKDGTKRYATEIVANEVEFLSREGGALNEKQ